MKRKIVDYKEPLTDPDESDIDENSFKSSTSKFNYIEEEGLRIKIFCRSSFSDVLGRDIPENNDPPLSAKELYLEDMTKDKVLIFHPEDCSQMSETASAFLVKLKLVLFNNAQISDVSREERFIDDMAIDLMRAVKYDDGKNFTMRSCTLKLAVGSKTFAAEADREGRRGTGIIWVMQENKHIDDTRYSEGDIQLVSCMIAAYQANRRVLRKVYPERIMGIKIKGDETYFYSLAMSQEYLDSLSKGIPHTDIHVYKYPDEIGLKISVPEERIQVINYLWAMRTYAMELASIRD
jgi:hypothetical protein